MRQQWMHARDSAAMSGMAMGARIFSAGLIARVTTAAALAIAMVLGSGCTQQRVADAPLQVWGYAAWWLPPSAERLQSAPIDRLLFFEIALSADGSIAAANGWPDRYRDLRDAAARQGTPLDLVLTLHGAEPFESLFSDADARRRLLATVEALAREPGVAGIQLDVEVYTPVSAQSIAGIRALVPQLAARLHALRPRRELTLFIPPVNIGLYDGAAVASVDWAVMQAYDAHWADGAEAGPVAPLGGSSLASWEQATKHAQMLGLTPDQTLLSYPLYGYEWPMPERRSRGAVAGPGRIATLAAVDPERLPLIRTDVRRRVERHGCSRDDSAGSMSYLFFDPQRGWVTGWYEGAWSLQRKRRFLVEERLAGIAFFVLGYDGYELVDGFERRRDLSPASPQQC